jgi:hypothetical protein
MSILCNFSIDSFAIMNTRARHEDTDYVAASVAVGNRPAVTGTRSMGDLNNGNYGVGIVFQNIEIRPGETAVFSYAIVNSGHQDPSWVEQQLQNTVATLATKGAQAAATAVGDAIGGMVGLELGTMAIPLIGSALGALAGWLVSSLGGIILANCDGPVASGFHVFPFDDIQRGTAGGVQPFGVNDDQPGVDSATGCGSNSHYSVAGSVNLVGVSASGPTAIIVPTGQAAYSKWFGFDVGADKFIRGANSGFPLKQLQWTGLLNSQTSPGAQINAVSRRPNQVDAFVIGLDSRVWTAAWNGEWAGWWQTPDQPCILGTSVGAVSRGLDQLDIFVVGPDRQVHSAAWGPQTNSEWAGWWQILDGKFPPGAPVSAVSCTTDEIDIFVVGTDGGVYSAAWGPWTDYEWGGWWRILDGLASPGSLVSAVSRKEDQIDIFGIGTDGFVYTAGWSPSQWGGWWKIGETPFAQGSAITAAAVGPDRLVVVGVTPDLRVCYSLWEPEVDGWSAWAQIGNGYALAGSAVALCVEGSVLHLLMTGLDGKTWRTATVFKHPGLNIPVPGGPPFYPSWEAWQQSPTG